LAVRLLSALTITWICRSTARFFVHSNVWCTPGMGVN
jgi:hypothetical protein